MKTCRGCNEDKPLASFHRDKGSPDGHHSRCMKCRNPKYREMSRTWYAANREAKKAHSLAAYYVRKESRS